MEFTFKLTFELPDSSVDTDVLIENLGAAGCTDALIGVGQPGRVALEFTREAQDEFTAKASAITDVKSVIPSASLVEIVNHVGN